MLSQKINPKRQTLAASVPWKLDLNFVLLQSNITFTLSFVFLLFSLLRDFFFSTSRDNLRRESWTRARTTRKHSVPHARVLPTRPDFRWSSFTTSCPCDHNIPSNFRALTQHQKQKGVILYFAFPFLFLCPQNSIRNGCELNNLPSNNCSAHTFFSQSSYTILISALCYRSCSI